MSRKILFLDIETLPNLIQALKHWPSLSSYPGTTFKGSLSSILCFGYKWRHEAEPKILNAWDYPEWHRDWRTAASLEEAVQIVNSDRQMCIELSEIIKQADAIVTHNGRKFDYKVLQTRMALHKIPILPTNITHVDTKNISSKTFSFVNNRLATISRLLGGEEKGDSGGWDSWIEAWRKNPEILKLISDYCKQDVVATENIYNTLHPASTIIPNANLYDEAQGKEHCCPNCGSTMLSREGFRQTATKLMIRYHCKNPSCGRWSQAPHSEARPR